MRAVAPATTPTWEDDPNFVPVSKPIGDMFALAAQMPEEEKVKLADFVIDNSGAREAVEAQVRKVWRHLQPLAR